MDILVEAESQDDIFYVHSKKTKIERDIKPQSDVKPKFDTDTKIKIEPIEEFNRGMGIITNMNVPIEAESQDDIFYVHPKKPKMEPDIKPQSDVKPKFDPNIKIKIELIEEFNRSMGIITNMNVPVEAESQNDIFYVHPKKPKMEWDIKPQSDVKPTFDSDIKIKIEPTEEFIRGMGIITNMNVPASAHC